MTVHRLPLLVHERSASIFFFFSSRRRHTRCLSDWSSDVCLPILDLGYDVGPANFGLDYTFGYDLNDTATSRDFFRVLSNTSNQAFGGGFSRTGGASGSL